MRQGVYRLFCRPDISLKETEERKFGRLRLLHGFKKVSAWLMESP